MYKVIIAFSFAVGFLHAQSATDQTADQTPKLSAREIFYKVLDEPAKPARQVKPRTAVKPSTSAKVKTDTPDPVMTAGVVTSRDPRSDSSASAPSSTADHQIFKVSDTQYPPMGLKYSLLQVFDEGNPAPVDPNHVFHSNDHMRLRLEVNSPGYLYVITRGASGRWSTLFPGKDSDSNYLKPGEKYYIPRVNRITFTDPAGQDRLFVYLSRQPVHSTEDLMLELSKGNTNHKTSTPAADHKEERPTTEMLQAVNRIDDNAVAALKELYSRDLIVETAPSASPEHTSSPDADSEGNSVYLVDKSGRADAHVVADITFAHE